MCLCAGTCISPGWSSGNISSAMGEKLAFQLMPCPSLHEKGLRIRLPLNCNRADTSDQFLQESVTHTQDGKMAATVQ